MPPVHDDALRKLENAKAMMDELLDPIEDAEALEEKAKRLRQSAGGGVA